MPKIIVLSDRKNNLAVANYADTICGFIDAQYAAAEINHMDDPAQDSIPQLRGADILHVHLHPDARTSLPLLEKAKRGGNQVVVTCHEWSRLDGEKKEQARPFLEKADWVVFVSEKDREEAIRAMPAVEGKSTALPMISSIVTPAARYQEKITRTEGLLASPKIVTFGMIAPDKGLEKVLEAARAAGNKMRFVIAGKIAPGCEEYAGQLQAQCKEAGVEWKVSPDGVPQSELSDMLHQCAFAYLPFKEGRGANPQSSTIAAAFEAGTVVISHEGVDTDAQMKKTCLLIDKPQDLPTIVERCRRERKLYDRMQFEAKAVEETRSLPVAEGYKQIYDACLARKRGLESQGRAVAY